MTARLVSVYRYFGKLVLVPFRYFSIDIYRNIDIFDNTNTYTYIYIYIYIYICIYVLYICIYVYVYMYICVCVCMYICVWEPLVESVKM